MLEVPQYKFMTNMRKIQLHWTCIGIVTGIVIEVIKFHLASRDLIAIPEAYGIVGDLTFRRAFDPFMVVIAGLLGMVLGLWKARQFQKAEDLREIAEYAKKTKKAPG